MMTPEKDHPTLVLPSYFSGSLMRRGRLDLILKEEGRKGHSCLSACP
jgi:hypothetical protein